LESEQRFSAEILNSISEINAAEWNSCTDGNPFLKHSFLAALETSKSASAETGWRPYHIILRCHGQPNPIAYLPCYLKSHSYGEYVFDHAWANAFERAGGRYYPKLQSSIPFTPVKTPRLLLAPTAPRGTKAALLRALSDITDQLGISSTHLTFLPEKEAELARQNGYLIRKDQQFHWHNKGYSSFEGFLADLSSRKRKQIKKERRTALGAGIEIEQIPGTAITEEQWDHFFKFYLDTGARKWGQPYLNRDFFSLISESMPDDIVLFMCKRDGRYIAGALNFISRDTLYGRYWGCVEDHPALHFETCYYQAIDYAITHKLAVVEAGAQGPHKLARGYVPVKTYSAHWIPDAGFRDAVAKFLEVEGHEVDAQVEYLATKTPFKAP